MVDDHRVDLLVGDRELEPLVRVVYLILEPGTRVVAVLRVHLGQPPHLDVRQPVREEHPRNETDARGLVHGFAVGVPA